MPSNASRLHVLGPDQRFHVTNAEQLNAIKQQQQQNRLVLAEMINGKDGREIWRIISNQIFIPPQSKINTSIHGSDIAFGINAKGVPVIPTYLGKTSPRESVTFLFSGSNRVFYVQNSARFYAHYYLLCLPTARLTTPQEVLKAHKNGLRLWFGDIKDAVLQPITDVKKVTKSSSIMLTTKFREKSASHEHNVAIEHITLQQPDGHTVRAEVPKKQQ